jgi:putative acetyltransferase
VSPVIRSAQAGELTHLIDESTLLLQSLYPEESNHLVDASDFGAPGNMLLGAFIDSHAIGCVGLLRTSPEEGEIKRLFVNPHHRGKGIARDLMSRLESDALTQGITTLRLETGIHQPESMALYESLGYLVRSPFGSYAEDPLSVFMEKKLS